MCPCPALCSSAGQVEGKECRIVWLLFIYYSNFFNACPNPPSLSCPAAPCPCLPPACSSPILPPHIPRAPAMHTCKVENVNCVWTRAEDLKVRAEQRRGSVHLLSCTWRCEVWTIYLAEMLTQTFWVLIHKKQRSRPRCTRFHDHAQFVFLLLPKQACRLVESPVEMFRKLAVCAWNTLLVN